MLALLQFALLGLGLGLLFRLVPNTSVRWVHAMSGGFFAALCMQLGRWGISWYLAKIPTYSMIYGTFATVPILLIWVYMAWLFILLGAVVAAYLPALLDGVARRPTRGGWRFQLALEVLQLLARARQGEAQGRSLTWMARRLQFNEPQIHPVLETLQDMGWAGLLAEARRESRWVLLVDPEVVSIAPLVDRLLFRRGPGTEVLWQRLDLDACRLIEVLPKGRLGRGRQRSVSLGHAAYRARKRRRQAVVG